MSSIFIRVAGVSYRQEDVAKCKVGQTVVFRLEIENKFDQHALKVMIDIRCCQESILDSEPIHVGYVPKDQAIDIKTAILAENYQHAIIDTIGRPAENKPLGMVVRLNFSGEAPKITR